MAMDPMPTYAWITNGTSNSYISIEEDKSISEIPVVVSEENAKNFVNKILTYRDKWSITKYQELQEAFDNIHELIYSIKDHVNNSNDAIDEFCKLIFMEEFRLNHKGYTLTQGSVAGKKLNEILNYENKGGMGIYLTPRQVTEAATGIKYGEIPCISEEFFTNNIKKGYKKIQF